MVPLPLHVGQVCGEPTAPLPWQVSQVSIRVICNFFTPPRTASQKSISSLYSSAPPGSASSSPPAPPRPPKKLLKRSRKLAPPPVAPLPPLKSNPPKSKLTLLSPPAVPAP